MAGAVALAKITGTAQVDEALGTAATYGRFAAGDLASILAASPRGPGHRADEKTSLAQGTAAWATIGQPGKPALPAAADATVEESA